MGSNRKRIALYLAVAAIAWGLVLAGNSRADLVATDLNTGGTDIGFSGNWAGSANRFILDANDLTYANYGITQMGTTQRVYGGNNSHPDRMDSRDLAAAMSGEIWFSVLVKVPAPTGTGFAGLAFCSDPLAAPSADYSHNAADLRIVMSPTQLWVDWQGGALNASWTPDATAGTFAADTTHLILGQMYVGVGIDTLNVWVDPDLTAVSGPGGLPAATYTNTTVDFTDSIVRIGVPLWVSGADTADAIWLSDTETAFFDVTGVTGSLSSDTNDDGVVDAADYIILKQNFGRTDAADAQNGNFTTGDTNVDWEDLSILMSNMGTGDPAPAAVPEPCSAMLLVFGAMGLLRRRRA